MIYVTGDTHGSFFRVVDFCKRMNTTKEDILIILGDAGINYYGDSKGDIRLKKKLTKLPITLFCIHGNHERRPSIVDGYELVEFNGGLVYAQPDFSNLLFAKDGEIYNLNDSKCMVIGGAFSVDKYYRLERGLHWFEDEQPSQEIKENVEYKLETVNWKVDIVLSHTCPHKYRPTEWFLTSINQDKVDEGTEIWLGELESKLDYKTWLCGHFHGNKTIDKMIFLFDDIIELK